MEDLGGVIWVVIVVLGILGKLFDKKGPKQPPVARTGRGGMPTMHPPQQTQQRPVKAPAKTAPVGRPVNLPDDDEGISAENVKPILHPWQEAKRAERVTVVTPEAAPTPTLPVQQAVVWAEILGKPAALRGPLRK